jgi:hypothetical protein
VSPDITGRKKSVIIPLYPLQGDINRKGQVAGLAPFCSLRLDHLRLLFTRSGEGGTVAAESRYEVSSEGRCRSADKL